LYVTDVAIVKGEAAAQAMANPSSEESRENPSGVPKTKTITRIVQLGETLTVEDSIRGYFLTPPPPRHHPFPPVPLTACPHITVTVSVKDFVGGSTSQISIGVAQMPIPFSVQSPDYATPDDVIVPGTAPGDPLYTLRFPPDLLNDAAVNGYIEHYCDNLVGLPADWLQMAGYLQGVPQMCRVHLEMLYKEVKISAATYSSALDVSAAAAVFSDKARLCSTVYTTQAREQLKQALSARTDNTSDLTLTVEEVVPPDHSEFTYNESPFQMNYESKYCTEPLWCTATMEMQRRLGRWQNPPPAHEARSERERRGCDGAKFLLFEPEASKNGIGSMLAQIAVVFRFALCHGRILYLLPPSHTNQGNNLRRWAHPQCESMSFLECYFQPITSCALTAAELEAAPTVTDGRLMQTWKYRDAKAVYLPSLPTTGHCTVCGSRWTGNTEFFDGLHIGVMGFVITPDPVTNHPDYSLMNILDPETKNLTSMVAFMDSVKLPWMAQMVRYMLRPRPWFSRLVRQNVFSRLTVWEGLNASNSWGRIPHPYASVHVRYGEKIIETENMPLHLYMDVLQRKAPHIRNVFVSTETERVIGQLARCETAAAALDCCYMSS
jgi:hypothetical protein